MFKRRPLESPPILEVRMLTLCGQAACSGVKSASDRSESGTHSGYLKAIEPPRFADGLWPLAQALSGMGACLLRVVRQVSP